MAYNSRQSNVFRSSQPKTPGTLTTTKKQRQQQLEHDLTLETADIVECLTELGIQFYVDDVKKPTPLKVQYLFENFVSSLMGVNRDSVEPIIRAASADQEFSDSHFEAAMLMAFYSSLSQLMMQCGVHDFTLNDILKPESERLRSILSNVINFLRYRGGKQEATDSLVARGEQAREQIERLLEENQDLERRVEELRAQRQREEPAIEQARRENLQLTEELRNYKKKQTGLVNQVDKFKEEKRALARTLHDQQFLIENNQRECHKLHPYIVDSPEQLQQVIGDLGRSLAKEREALDAAERQVRALQTSADSFSIVEADVTNCIKVMEDCQKELAKQEDCERKLQRHQENLHQKMTEVKEIKRKEERLKRTLSNAEEKLERARSQAAARRDATKQEMERLKAEYTTLSEERARTTRQIDKINSRIDIKQKEMAELRARLEEEVALAQTEYERLRAHIELYMDKMAQMMNMA